MAQKDNNNTVITTALAEQMEQLAENEMIAKDL